MVNELAWGGYQNGRIPLNVLKPIPWATGQRLRPDATDALVRLNEPFRARFGKNIAITDSYRDYEAQVRLKAAKGYLAATPGTSNHGWGRALDLATNINNFGTAEHTWMRSNAPGFGWVLPSWAQQGGSKPEPWHWEFPYDTQEDDMFSDQDRAMLQDVSRKIYETATEVGNTKAGVWTGGSALIDGVAQKFSYGALPVVTHNQTLLAQIIAELAEIKKSVAAK